MRIGVVSDTHDQMVNTRRAVELLVKSDVKAVVHCGDIVSPEVIGLFAHWPSHFVFGNCDGSPGSLRMAIQEGGQTCHERFGRIELAGRHIAFLHGDDSETLDQAVRSGEYDLVCHGHTHKYGLHRHGRTLVLNPGALQRARPHTFAVVDLVPLDVRFISLEANGELPVDVIP